MELWNLATQANFELARLGNRKNLEKMASSDLLEIKLRNLAAFVYEQRAHDKAGPAHIIADVALAGHTGVAPSWLVTEATAYSKLQHQSAELQACQKL